VYFEYSRGSGLGLRFRFGSSEDELGMRLGFRLGASSEDELGMRGFRFGTSTSSEDELGRRGFRFSASDELGLGFRFGTSSSDELRRSVPVDVAALGLRGFGLAGGGGSGGSTGSTGSGSGTGFALFRLPFGRPIYI
jgi:hypothetical protein